MNKLFKLPPKSADHITTPDELVRRLFELVGSRFKLTGKTRTDGSNIRKLVASTLEKYPLPPSASVGEFEIVPPKEKGVPKIKREFLDTYIVTSGNSYNLQVWNRIPASNTLLIKFDAGRSLKCNDVRFVLVRIDVKKKLISSILVLTPKYIEKKFGKFGKPTIKHQMLISTKSRNEIYKSDDKIMFYSDSKKMSYLLKHKFEPPKSNIVTEPSANEIYSLELIKEMVAENLIGTKLVAAATKNRGQALERKVLDLLGYSSDDNNLLYGAFPDIKNQLLEVKVQDTQTVDLGKYSPETEEIIIPNLNITTFDVRYLIALTNSDTEIIEGIILAPGEKLGEVFSYVSDQSFKCQRSIPMDFIDKYYGKAVFNPD